MKYFKNINMGEGIAGGPDVGMATTQLYSCMGIVMVNTRNTRAGLYHYPSLILKNPNISGTIRQMYNDLQPDIVALTPAKSHGGGTGSTADDIRDVTTFLEGLGAKVDTRAAGSIAQFHWDGATPVFNVARDGGAEMVDTQLRKVMKTAGRNIEGDIWYYGGDGENDDDGDVLEQGLPVTKLKKKKARCVIL